MFAPQLTGDVYQIIHDRLQCVTDRVNMREAVASTGYVIEPSRFDAARDKLELAMKSMPKVFANSCGAQVDIRLSDSAIMSITKNDLVLGHLYVTQVVSTLRDEDGNLVVKRDEYAMNACMPTTRVKSWVNGVPVVHAMLQGSIVKPASVDGHAMWFNKYPNNQVLSWGWLEIAKFLGLAAVSQHRTTGV